MSNKLPGNYRDVFGKCDLPADIANTIKHSVMSPVTFFKYAPHFLGETSACFFNIALLCVTADHVNDGGILSAITRHKLDDGSIRSWASELQSVDAIQYNHIRMPNVINYALELSRYKENYCKPFKQRMFSHGDSDVHEDFDVFFQIVYGEVNFITCYIFNANLSMFKDQVEDEFSYEPDGSIVRCRLLTQPLRTALVDNEIVTVFTTIKDELNKRHHNGAPVIKLLKE